MVVGTLLTALSAWIVFFVTPTTTPIDKHPSINPIYQLDEEIPAQSIQPHIATVSMIIFTLLFIGINIISYLTNAFSNHLILPTIEVFWYQTIVSLIFCIIHYPLTFWLVFIDDHLIHSPYQTKVRF
jgi:hypothetical protein